MGALSSKNAYGQAKQVEGTHPIRGTDSIKQGMRFVVQKFLAMIFKDLLKNELLQRATTFRPAMIAFILALLTITLAALDRSPLQDQLSALPMNSTGHNSQADLLESPGNGDSSIETHPGPLELADLRQASNSGSKNLALSSKDFGTGSNAVIASPGRDRDQSGKVIVTSIQQTARTRQVKEDDLEMPDWQKIISPDGSAIDLVGERGRGGTDGTPDYRQLYPAFEAGYIEEIISNGLATDSSALLIAREVQDEVLYNGAVSAAHDLGNAYYLLALSQTGGLRLYTGVERLRSDLPTFIEFELNQIPVGVDSGIPWWHIKGQRQNGDLLVRFNITAGNLSSVELAVWNESYFHIFESDTQVLGNGCREHFNYIYCVGSPPLDRSQQLIEVWDQDYHPLDPVLADSFIELGIDFARMLDSATEFSSLYIRTPEDVVMTSFRSIGQGVMISMVSTAGMAIPVGS